MKYMVALAGHANPASASGLADVHMKQEVSIELNSIHLGIGSGMPFAGMDFQPERSVTPVRACIFA